MREVIGSVLDLSERDIFIGVRRRKRRGWWRDVEGLIVEDKWRVWLDRKDEFSVAIAIFYVNGFGTINEVEYSSQVAN